MPVKQHDFQVGMNTWLYSTTAMSIKSKVGLKGQSGAGAKEKRDRYSRPMKTSWKEGAYIVFDLSILCESI